MGYKAVIFDLDGTLVNTVGDLANSMNFALSSLGLPNHSVEDCIRMIGSGMQEFARQAAGKGNESLCTELIKRLRAHYLDNCLVHSSVYDGMAEVVFKLKNRGFLLAIVTNKDQDAANRVTKHFFGSGVFERVIGVASDGICVKPDPWAVKQVLNDMDVSFAQAVLIGDSDVDIKTAKNAEIFSIGVTWGYRSREVLREAGAGKIVENACEILELLS